jgi:hypothetical protein
MLSFAKEPARLHAEQKRIEDEIVQVAVSQHPALTRSVEVARVAAIQINQARKSAAKAKAALEDLKKQCTDLSQYGQTYRTDRQRINTALANHPKLSELLDAPATLELCLRNDMYHEAILVLEHVASVTQRSEGSPVMLKVLEQCVENLQRMLHHIISTKLSGPLNASQAVRTVQFLLRMGIPLKQVKALFLEQRSVYIDQLLVESSQLTTSSYGYLTKLLTILKVHVSEVATHYDSCFGTVVGKSLDQVSPTASDAPGAIPQQGSPGGAASSTSGDAAQLASREDLHSLCHTWLNRTIREFDQHLPRISSGSELRSLSEQVGHVSIVLSREGLDIASLIYPAIKARILSNYEDQIKQSVAGYKSSLDSFNWREAEKAISRHGSNADLVRSKAGSSQDLAGTTTSDDDRTPPSRLLSVPPLGAALNGILTAFNELRKCIFPSIIPICLNSLQQAVSEMVSAFVGVGGGTSASTASRPKIYEKFAECFVEDFFPYLLWATKRLFTEPLTLEFSLQIASTANELRPLLPVPSPSAAQTSANASRPQTPPAAS